MPQITENSTSKWLIFSGITEVALKIRTGR
jgi:hypothetical protein